MAHKIKIFLLENHLLIFRILLGKPKNICDHLIAFMNLLQNLALVFKRIVRLPSTSLIINLRIQINRFTFKLVGLPRRFFALLRAVQYEITMRAFFGSNFVTDRATGVSLISHNFRGNID